MNLSRIFRSMPMTAVIAAAFVMTVRGQTGAAQRPNVVLILADDMGYGDPGCYNPNSKTPTPNIDRLAEQGMRFTDAHSPGSWCVPTRYGLLTGRYPFRTSLNWRRRRLIQPGRTTLASFLKHQGYATAMIGKWHLGFDGGPNYDFALPLRGGPVDNGFDSYFGIPHSLDIQPYYYIRNDRAVLAPTQRIRAMNSPGWSRIQGKFWREGDIAPGFDHQAVLPRLAFESVKKIQELARQNSPFFLYIALTSPHTPWLPTARFLGTSQVELYGDFVAQTDQVVGDVLHALEIHQLADNTLVVFTSDNGPVWYPSDVKRFDHSSAFNLRGMKGDAWEGGHRIPMIVRWPGHVKPGSASNQMVCQTDFLATFAAVLDQELPDHAGEDSISVLPTLLGSARSTAARKTMITLSSRGVLAFREGPWKLIPRLGSGGFTQPAFVKPGPDDPKGQLYDLSHDLGETRNLWKEEIAVVRRLERRLQSEQ